MSNVLNTAFFLPFGFRGVVRNAAEAALVQGLLCYDEVWVLTDQMSAVGMIAGIVGFDALERALDQGTLSLPA